MSYTDKLISLKNTNISKVSELDTIHLSEVVLKGAMLDAVCWVFLFYLMSMEIWDSQVCTVMSSKCTRSRTLVTTPYTTCTPQLLLGECIDQLTQHSFIKDLTLECVEPNPGPLTTSNKPKNRNPKQRRYNPSNNYNRPYDPTLPYSHFMKPRQNVQKYSETITVSYPESSKRLNNAGSPIQVVPLYTNDGYDLFPGILTPTIPMINNKFQLYKFAKIKHLRYYFAFNNLEQNAVDVYFFASAQSMASIFSSTAAIDTMASTKNLVWTGIIPEQYAKETIFAEFGVCPWRSLGNWMEYNSSNDFSFTVSTNPARLTHGALVISSAAGTALTNGITYRLMIDIKIKFYDPVDLTAPLYKNLVTTDTDVNMQEFPSAALLRRDKTPVSQEPAAEIVVEGRRYVLKQ